LVPGVPEKKSVFPGTCGRLQAIGMYSRLLLAGHFLTTNHSPFLDREGERHNISRKKYTSLSGTPCSGKGYLAAPKNKVLLTPVL